jgi:hypothetical protein
MIDLSNSANTPSLACGRHGVEALLMQKQIDLQGMQFGKKTD